jgi:hypothetical protein
MLGQCQELETRATLLFILTMRLPVCAECVSQLAAAEGLFIFVVKDLQSGCLIFYFSNFARPTRFCIASFLKIIVSE